ncbi:UNVERIFIED_CONTAM: hypothetical protein GTU68_011612 [Idotea baltica]|nr:hypothetical protein [Idotea baltica]
MRQEYSNYTTEDHEVWEILYKEQMSHLPNKVTSYFLKGIEIVGFEPHKIPTFERLNQGLAEATGWSVFVVPGLIDNKPFFEHLANKEFPATTWLRKKSQLEYLEEPDMFHDIFGHVPLLSVPKFCNYLTELSEIVLQHIENPNVVEVAARLYWYTVEFGMIQENGDLKIYGAGISSSSGESRYCVGNEAIHLPYDVKKIFKTPYVKDNYQAQYFVIDSYQQLYDSLPFIKREIEKIVEESIYIEPSYA